MAGELYCPHCYKEINENNLLFFKASCGEKMPFASPSLLQKWGVASPPQSILCAGKNKSNCKNCDKVLSFRACPFCKKKIPGGRIGKPRIIAVFGATGAGKSSYIHAVVDQLRRMSERCAWTIMEQETEADQNAMYLIRRRRADKGELIVFAEVTEEKLTAALKKSLSGIVCLVDPWQIEAVRKEVKTSNPLPEIIPTESHRVLLKLSQTCASVPLAVTVSKLDSLICSDKDGKGRFLLKTNERMVCRDSVFGRAVFRDELETVDCEMGNWVEAADVKMANACKQFSQVRFFGCSSQDPALRVADPLLWILSQNRILGIK